ncbi:MAG: zinc-dependent dehydrogenase [Clostridiales Family XIII bacterium]|jgi:L-iditol 2-dehydrogenase|nr:zinc-dependent dehydrogenase [Clostridiales Family XIII bacterium]
MKAAVLETLEHLIVKEVPDPVIGPDEALVKVWACAVCGSDIRIFRHGNSRVRPPAILGHESSGEIVAVGDRVTGFSAGDRVALGSDVPCGECAACKAGFGNNCRINYAMGYQFQGSFAEYVPLNRIMLNHGPVHKIPPGMGYDEAALAEPLACVLNAVEFANVKLGDTVVVMGAGPIGCMIIPVALMSGATKVIAINRSPGRLEFAKQAGADVAICSSEEDPVARVLEETDGFGADVVFTANPTPQSHIDALKMAKNRGRVNLFGGLPAGTKVELETNLIHYKELLVSGAHGSVPRHHKQALDLIASGRPDIRPFISHRFSLDEIGQAFRTAESKEGLRVIVKPWGKDGD